MERRVLWLATAIVHHANRVRESRSGVKVGGHQASSASMVSLMTALWFAELRAEDRVSVKPHASPVLHAINYLLGRLGSRISSRCASSADCRATRAAPRTRIRWTTRPARSASATAPVWGAIARRYLEYHRAPPMGRQIALLGDAELDEGAVWEAIADPWVEGPSRRGALDRRPQPAVARPRRAGHRLGRLAGMFDAAGWQVITVKYGRLLDELFARPGGPALRRRIDEMPNEEYQRLLRATGGAARAASRRRPRAGGAGGRARRLELRAGFRTSAVMISAS